MRPILLAMVLLSSLVWPAAQPGAAQQGGDLAAAATAAGEILNLAADRKFNAMYDLIHPDAMAVVPRAAAVGAFQELYQRFRAGEAEILGVESVDWTWGVTGKRYPGAAAVRFAQPYVDEQGRAQRLDDTMYLVSVDGAWRWFFGSSRQAIEAAIARYGQGTSSVAPPALGTLTEGNLLQNVVNDLDAFYADVLSYTDSPYRSPGVVLVSPGERVQTGCGAATQGFWAFYCPNDQTVYLEAALLGQLQQEADFVAAFVVAHEWAHHVQTAVGFNRVEGGFFDRPGQWNEVYSIELELMADCMGGAWAQDADTRGLLEEDDIEETVAFTVQTLGDPSGIGETDPQAHGTGAQRRQAFLLGYQDGFLGCNLTL